MVTDDDSGTARGAETTTGRTSKVARLIDEYELGPTFGAELEALWTAEGDERMSLRSLAELFNERLLESAVDDAGMSTLDGEVSNIYRLLRDDEVSSGERTEVRTRLDQRGVDVDALEEDFVTYQAIRTYLTAYRGAEYTEVRDEARRDKTIETIQRLESRIRAVARNGLERLQSKGLLTLGTFRVFVEIEVLCEECNTQYGVVELLEGEGCDCRNG